MDTEEATATRRAEDARRTVAEQVTALVTEGGMTGSRDFLALRFRSLLEAERRGDQLALRAASVELSAAAALWAVDIDVKLCAEPNGTLRW